MFGGLALVVVVAVVALALSGGGGTDSARGAEQETAAVEVEGTSLPTFPGNDATDPAVGETAPTLVGETFDTSAVTIGPTGTPQIVVFLSHSCPHCQAEVPLLVELADRGVFDGIDIAAVATNTSDQLANYPPSAWLEREQWPFPVLLDDEQGTAGQAYGLPAFPFFVFLDADGTVVGRATGELSAAALDEVASALRDDGGSSSAN
jgi:thiol-disulfide isomerase/thioredoxin